MTARQLAARLAGAAIGGLVAGFCAAAFIDGWRDGRHHHHRTVTIHVPGDASGVVDAIRRFEERHR